MLILISNRRTKYHQYIIYWWNTILAWLVDKFNEARNLTTSLTLNSIKMRLLFFILSGIMISTTLGLTSGLLQNYVKFNSVDSEIFVAILCGVAGLFFLIYSVERDETENE